MNIEWNYIIGTERGYSTCRARVPFGWLVKVEIKDVCTHRDNLIAISICYVFDPFKWWRVG